MPGECETNLTPHVISNTEHIGSSDQEQHENINQESTPLQSHIQPAPIPSKPRDSVRDVQPPHPARQDSSPHPIPPTLFPAHPMVIPSTVSPSNINVENINPDSDQPSTEWRRSNSTEVEWRRSTTEQDHLALGIINFDGPAHSNYVTEQHRLSSFSSWPPGLNQKPKELAQTGFFYTGWSDQVKCFYCDGGLESWEPEDSPWGEHSKWFPDCAFLKMVRAGNKNVEIRCIMEKEKTVTTFTKQIKVKQQPETKTTEFEGLKKEAETLREERMCKICLEKEAFIVFLPCGHLCSCASCAPALTSCAVCRTKISGMVRTFMV